jgi:hypothetical protein
MAASLNQYLKKRNYYDSPSLSKAPEDELSRDHLKYEEKCLSAFCLRPRYLADDTAELFCSELCKHQHEELYAD